MVHQQAASNIYNAPTGKTPVLNSRIALFSAIFSFSLLATTILVSADEVNPFSNTKPDPQNEAMRQEITSLDQRLHQMEGKVTAIQQVQVAVPADALNQGPGAKGAGPAAGGGLDEESVELQAATFIACVNGKAMFRDSDQKPFFVDAKHAEENDSVRRLGGCKP